MDALSHRERFPSPRVAVVGALDLVPGEAGVRPRRLPAWTAPQIPTPNYEFVLSMTSGVRLVTRTSASTLELIAEIIAINPFALRPAPVVLDLLVDGVHHARKVIPPEKTTLVDPHTYAFERRSDPVTVRFDGLGIHEKTIELWLPHTCSIELIELRADAPLERAVDSRSKWVHHGSSISQGGEASAPTKTWPVIAANRAGVTVTNLGFSGNAVGDPFVARTIRDLAADAISLEIGVNVVNGDLMRRRSFEPLLHGFLDTVRDGHPETPLLLIGPIPCPSIETLPGPTIIHRGMAASGGDPRQLASGGMSLEVVRDALATVIHARSDPHLSFLDGRMLLRPDEVVDLDDGLHPNARALARMGNRFARHAFVDGPFAHLAQSG